MDIQLLDIVSQSARLVEEHYYIGFPLKIKTLQPYNNRTSALNVRKASQEL